jgi:hypothetical protein
LFYVVIRGGLIVPSLPTGQAGNEVTRLLNPYGIAAIAALAGMFSRQATDKLREMFDTLFRTREPVIRSDPLARTIPLILGTNPDKLTVNGPRTVDVLGRGFHSNCSASINGQDREVQWLTETQIKLTLHDADIAAPKKLELSISNPGPSGGHSESYKLQVETTPREVGGSR